MVLMIKRAQGAQKTTGKFGIKKICYIYITQNTTVYVRFRYVVVILLMFAVTGYSCREKGGKYIDQGEIHYNIEYSGNFGLPKEALPQNLIVSFKKNKILFEMTGLGNSGIVNLSNPEKGIYDTYFSFFVKKFYYAAEPGEVFPGFEAMKGMSIRKTMKTAVLCGYNCRNAEVTLPTGKKYQIWYTNEIKVKNPNAGTPYNELDGVLMSFFFIMGSSELQFTAETVYAKELPDNAFDRKQGYVKVTKDNIVEIINRMISL